MKEADEEDIDEVEIAKFYDALSNIIEITRNQQPFFCKDIKEVMKEKDALQKKILDLVQQAEQEKIKLSKEYDLKI